MTCRRRFIDWTRETYTAGGHKAELIPLLERCTSTLQSDERYRNDPRFLRIWILYVRGHVVACVRMSAQCVCGGGSSFVTEENHRFRAISLAPMATLCRAAHTIALLFLHPAAHSSIPPPPKTTQGGLPGGAGGRLLLPGTERHRAGACTFPHRPRHLPGASGRLWPR